MLRKAKNHRLVRDNRPPEEPAEYLLAQNSPNPFRIQTGIGFSVPRPGRVKIMVFNHREEQQCILHDGHLDPGCYRLIWNGVDADNHPLKPGSYDYCLQAGDFFATRKLIICK